MTHTLTCPTCRQGTLTRTSTGLLKCSICSSTFKPGQSTPLLREHATNSIDQNVQISDTDMQTFIDRVARKLMPVYKDYAPSVKKELFTNQAKIKKSLIDVFEGKTTLEKWFNKTRRDLGKHAIDLTQIMVDSLEGLQSKEAQEMRLYYEKALSDITAQYRPDLTIAEINRQNQQGGLSP